MANAVTAEFTPSIDRKKGRFLGLFCRKTGVRPKLFNTLLCVFTCFWDSRLFQTLAPQGEPARGRLQNKSYLKTYRRFFVRSGMCLNIPMKVVLTDRDEGCERSAALRATACLSRNDAGAWGARAPSPTTAHRSNSPYPPVKPLQMTDPRSVRHHPQGLIGTGRSIKARQSQSKLTNLTKVKFADRSDAQPRSQTAGTMKPVQLAERWCNSTATGLQLISRNCTRLHQIAPNCTKLRLINNKTVKK